MHFEIETVVARPRDAVWQVLSDRAALPRWQPHLRHVEPLAGAPGQVGSTTRLVYHEAGRTLEVVETIVAADAPERFGATYDAGLGACRMLSTLADLGDGRTGWRVAADVELKAWYLKLAEPMIRGLFEQRMRENVARFRQLAEAGAIPPAPPDA